jgi:vitamin B12 transporter
MIKYYTTFTTNRLGLRRPNIDDPTLKNAFGLKNTNWYQNLSWRESLGKGWKMNLACQLQHRSYRLQQPDTEPEQPAGFNRAGMDRQYQCSC